MEQHTIIVDTPDTGLPTHLDGENTLVLVFASRVTLERGDLLGRLRERFPASRITGCSTCGHFVGSHLDDDHVVVSVLRFDHARLDVASVAIESPEESFTAGRSDGAWPVRTCAPSWSSPTAPAATGPPSPTG